MTNTEHMDTYVYYHKYTHLIAAGHMHLEGKLAWVSVWVIMFAVNSRHIILTTRQNIADEVIRESLHVAISIYLTRLIYK